MSRWFRHYAGMMRDEKLVSVAIKSKQPIERVLWIWGAILESAAEIDDNGRYELDPAEVAYFLRTDEDDVGAVLAALAGAGRVDENFVVKWGDRQFQSDRSQARVAAHRQRKRAENRGCNGERAKGNGDVTLQKRRCNAPETETETETEEPKGSPPVVPQRKSRSRRKGEEVPMPADWEPSFGPKTREMVEGWPPGKLDRELRKFRNHAADKGRTSVDWNAALRTWLENADEWMTDNDRQSRPQAGKRNGIADALDREIGFGQSTGSPERRAISGSGTDRPRAIAGPSPG